MGTIAEKLNYLDQTKQEIKNALIEKEVSISDTDTFRSYAGKIKEIETGIDTSDADATDSDIINGKTAYVDGQKITGSLIVSMDNNAKIKTPANGSRIVLTDITEINGLDTSDMTNIKGIFGNLTQLTTIGELNGSKVMGMDSYSFNQCTLLENFGGIKDLGKGYYLGMTKADGYLRLEKCTKLTYESLLNAVNKVYDIKAKGLTDTYYIYIASACLSKLQATEEGLAAIENLKAKGWNISGK